jgi:hypothetical protein
VLAVAAGLFVRTFARLASMPLGFDADRVIVANINATRSSTPMAARFDLYQRIANALDTVPSVAEASGSLITPLTGQNWTAPLIVPGAPELSDQDRTTSINVVTPRWFATYGNRWWPAGTSTSATQVVPSAWQSSTRSSKRDSFRKDARSEATWRFPRFRTSHHTSREPLSASSATPSTVRCGSPNALRFTRLALRLRRR